MTCEETVVVPVRALVVATLPSVRAALEDLLVEGGIEVVAHVSVETLEAPTRAVDVLVVDAPDGMIDGLAALDELGIPIVMLADEPYQAAAPRRAPRASLARDLSAEELAAAVTAVAHGMTVLGPGKVGADPASAVDDALTARELEVLRLAAGGLTNKAIARRLAISEHTVKFHMRTLLAKLQAASRAEAVSVAVRRGLLAL